MAKFDPIAEGATLKSGFDPEKEGAVLRKNKVSEKKKYVQQESMLGQLDPFGLGGEEGRKAAIESAAFAIPVGRAAKLLPEGASAISKGLANFGGLVGQSSATGAATNALEGNSAKEGALGGAIGGAIGATAIPLAGKAINKLRPSSLLKSNLSNEELKRNLEATSGTDTPLGRVIDSPSLNFVHENILPHVIGSGATDKMQKTANSITEKGHSLLGKIKGDVDPGDLNFKLKSALQKASQEARNEKNAGFEKLNKIADESGLQVNRENFKSKANEVIDEINKSPELKEEFSPNLYKDLLRYSSNEKGNNLKLTNIFRGKLGDKANELYQAGKMHEYGIVNDLKEALSNDINSSFEKSGNKELKDAYQKNQKDYAEKFAPFEDKDIVKFTRKGGDPDLILSHFLKGGKNDRSNLLDKLISKLPEEDKSLISYAHFSKSLDENGKLDPIKMKSLYEKLGEKQKKTLIRDEKLKDELKNYSRLIDKNKESFDLMRNPKTGARNTDLLIKLTQLLGGTAAGGLGGLLGTTVGSAIAGRGATKALTSEKLRNNLINAMIKNKKIKSPGRQLVPGLSSLISGGNNKSEDQ